MKRKLKFKFWWIFVALLVVWIGLQFIPLGSSPSIKVPEIPYPLGEMIKYGDIDRIITVPEERVAYVYIEKDKIKSGRYILFFADSEPSDYKPHFHIKFTTLNAFFNLLDSVQKDIPIERRIFPNIK